MWSCRRRHHHHHCRRDPPGARRWLLASHPSIASSHSLDRSRNPNAGRPPRGGKKHSYRISINGQALRGRSAELVRASGLLGAIRTYLFRVRFGSIVARFQACQMPQQACKVDLCARKRARNYHNGRSGCMVGPCPAGHRSCSAYRFFLVQQSN